MLTQLKLKYHHDKIASLLIESRSVEEVEYNLCFIMF